MDRAAGGARNLGDLREGEAAPAPSCASTTFSTCWALARLSRAIANRSWNSSTCMEVVAVLEVTVKATVARS